VLQPKVVQVKPLENYNLLLLFDTKEQKVFDVSPYISGDWFGKLKSAEYFKTVQVSGNTVEWRGGQDIAPHELYDNGIRID